MEKTIIEDFYQGNVIIREEIKECLDDYKNGNCVTIALIKSAIVQFGSIDAIFKSFDETNNKTTVVFKDSFEASVNLDEINIVKNISGIIPHDNSIYYETAIKLFSIIAKRIYLTKENFSSECITDFKSAVEYLNAGYSTKKAYKLLALQKKEIKKKNIKKFKSAIIYSGAHASYCSYGYQDIFGKTYKIKRVFGINWMKNPRGIGGTILGAYILK
ncbi:hypothetical protein [Olleya sp. R77988]|uniref:hypothetical protein n=1 Tax=Olleya sp. R77988 TaxID=3093875 RepID=UPI0037C5E5C3